MAHVEIVRKNLGAARCIGGLVGRRNGNTYLIVDYTVTLRTIIDLARELLDPAEMTDLRNRRACELAWGADAA